MRLRSLLSLLLLSPLLGACAHTPPNESGVYATAAPQVLVADDRGEPGPLAEGQPLHSGQVFAVTLELEHPAHVYIIHRRGMVLSDLYPSLGVSDSALPPGTVRIPAGDAFMRVPPLDRQSRVCVLLSPYPIDGQQRRCPEGHPHHHSKVQSFALPLPRL